MHLRVLIFIAAILAIGLVVAQELRLAALSGGDFTVVDESELAYSHPAPNLEAAQVELFANGR